MSEVEQRLLMLIDDEPAQCRLISALAAREGWRTIVVRDSETAIATLGTRQGMQLSAIILDQWVPGDDACALIAELKSRRPALPLLMLTTSASPLLAVEAMRAGATDYLIKPVAPDRLMLALRAATTRESPQDELAPLTEKMHASLDFDSMIGAAPTFRSALAIAAKAARGHGPVLIEGETGTGKEMLVRAMHAASPRSRMAMRMINIGGMPANSIESTLFGHERGAFPGAFDRQIGALQHCDGGTLVLDEIDRLPDTMQERLFESIARSDVRPIGARHSFKVDVRLIAASNLPLKDLVHAGHFMPELHQALSATTVALPPLRERAGDIPALARHFLGRIGEQPGLRPLGITDGALSLLGVYDWPGNVRQLENAVYRAIVLADAPYLQPYDFPAISGVAAPVPEAGDAPMSHAHPPVASAGELMDDLPKDAPVRILDGRGHLRTLEDIERDLIQLAIEIYAGHMSEVARRLGIGRSTLYRKVREQGLEDVIREASGEAVPGTDAESHAA